MLSCFEQTTCRILCSVWNCCIYKFNLEFNHFCDLFHLFSQLFPLLPSYSALLSFVLPLVVFVSCSIPSFPGSSVPLQLGLPVAVPPQYSGLKEVSIEAVRARLRLLYHFSDLMYSSWRLLNLSPNNQVGKEPQHKCKKLNSFYIWHSLTISHLADAFIQTDSQVRYSTKQVCMIKPLPWELDAVLQSLNFTGRQTKKWEK